MLFQKIFLSVLSTLFLISIACSDDTSDPSDGDTPHDDGDASDGDFPDGDAPYGDDDPSDSDDLPADGDSSDGDSDDDIDGDTDGDTDGNSENDSEQEPPEDTDPPLLEGDIEACTASGGSADLLLIKGTLVTPTEAYLNGELLTDAVSGKVLCAGENCVDDPSANGATVICADGIILPGMLDPHNHSWYNTIPRWRHPGDDHCQDCTPGDDCPADGQDCRRKNGLYTTRHSWPDDTDYQNQLKAYYNGLKDDYECEMQKWAEARMLIHGTTGVAGACQMRRCYNMLARNLDLATSYSGLEADRMQTNIYEVKTITNDADQVANYCAKFAAGDTSALLLHVAEGVSDHRNRTEFWNLWMPDDEHPETTLMVEELVHIHGTGAYTDELALLACSDAKLVWSPRSNIDLYGQTTNIPLARNLGIRLALGPDWTPSGSLSQLQEMRCAHYVSERYWNDSIDEQILVRWVTDQAAQVLGIDDQIGKLATGYLADAAIVSADDYQRRRPFRRIVEAEAWDIRLTLVGGVPVYGDVDLAPYGPYCETLDVCGETKILCMKQGEDDTDFKNQTLTDIRQILETNIATLREAAAPEDSYLFELFPLFLCPGTQAYADDQPEAVCAFKHNPHPDVLFPAIPATPIADDRDEDGWPDDSDNCPDINNADQLDRNENGVGDACEAIPLSSEDCPRTADDGCQVAGEERKPRLASMPPFEEAPTRQIFELKTPGLWTRLSNGEKAMLSAVTVTAAVEDGFFVQESDSKRYAGLFVAVDKRPSLIVPGRILDLSGTVRVKGERIWLELDSYNLADLCDLTRPDPPQTVNLGAAEFATDSNWFAYDGMRVVITDPTWAVRLGGNKGILDGHGKQRRIVAE